MSPLQWVYAIVAAAIVAAVASERSAHDDRFDPTKAMICGALTLSACYLIASS